MLFEIVDESEWSKCENWHSSEHTVDHSSHYEGSQL